MDINVQKSPKILDEDLSFLSASLNSSAPSPPSMSHVSKLMLSKHHPCSRLQGSLNVAVPQLSEQPAAQPLLHHLQSQHESLDPLLTQELPSEYLVFGSQQSGDVDVLMQASIAPTANSEGELNTLEQAFETEQAPQISTDKERLIFPMLQSQQLTMPVFGFPSPRESNGNPASETVYPRSTEPRLIDGQIPLPADFVWTPPREPAAQSLTLLNDEIFPQETVIPRSTEPRLAGGQIPLPADFVWTPPPVPTEKFFTPSSQKISQTEAEQMINEMSFSDDIGSASLDLMNADDESRAIEFIFGDE